MYPVASDGVMYQQLLCEVQCLTRNVASWYSRWHGLYKEEKLEEGVDPRMASGAARERSERSSQGKCSTNEQEEIAACKRGRVL